MGLLRNDETLEWSEILKVKDEIKENGIQQFIKVYKDAKPTFVHDFIWGDELEMMIVCRKEVEEGSKKEVACDDKGKHKYVLCLNSDLLEQMKKINMSVEFASYMVETTPTLVHQSSFNSLLKVESCMLTRYECMKRYLKKKGALPLMTTCFPKLGHYNSFNIPVSYSYSKFFPDEAITKHRRFHSFVKNIIERRGKRVEGYIRIMDNDITNDNDTKKNKINSETNKSQEKGAVCDIKKHKSHLDQNKNEQENNNENINNNNKIAKTNEHEMNNTNDINSETENKCIRQCENDKSSGPETSADTKKDHIGCLKTNTYHALPEDKYIRVDSMGQGMGCCCLQLTLQASTIVEARKLYDNIGALCPLLLRLTRATSISQGRVLQTETRWDMLVYSVDCRTDEERRASYHVSGEGMKSLTSQEMSNKPDALNHRACSSNSTLDSKNFHDARNDSSLQTNYSKDNNYSQNNTNNSAEACNSQNESQNTNKFENKSLSQSANYQNNSGTLNNEGLLKESNLNSSLSEASNKKDKNSKSSQVNTNSSQNHTKSNKSQKSNLNFLNEKTPIKKSRFSSIDTYLMEDAVQYNDLNPPLHKLSYDTLREAGVDDVMSQHISSLFIRDPILVYASAEKHETDDFENIQSSNWRSMRFKLPAKTTLAESGWKVEVRPMEIQPTCFENTSWCIFVVLLSRAVVAYDLDFHIPLSLVDENFRRVNLCIRKMSDYKSKLDEDKMLFYYRVNIFDKESAVVKEGTIKEIFMGQGHYEGIYNVVKRFIEEHCGNDLTASEGLKENEIFTGEKDKAENSCKPTEHSENCSASSSNNICCIENVFTDKVRARTLDDYLEFVRARIENEYMSVSDFMRMFVVRNDGLNGSIVKENVLDDMMDVMIKAGNDNCIDYLKNQ